MKGKRKKKPKVIRKGEMINEIMVMVICSSASPESGEKGKELLRQVEADAG